MHIYIYIHTKYAIAVLRLHIYIYIHIHLFVYYIQTHVHAPKNRHVLFPNFGPQGRYCLYTWSLWEIFLNIPNAEPAVSRPLMAVHIESS